MNTKMVAAVIVTALGLISFSSVAHAGVIIHEGTAGGDSIIVQGARPEGEGVIIRDGIIINQAIPTSDGIIVRD